MSALDRLPADGADGAKIAEMAAERIGAPQAETVTDLVWCIRSSPDIKCRPPPLRRSVSSRKLFSNPLGKP